MRQNFFARHENNPRHLFFAAIDEIIFQCFRTSDYELLKGVVPTNDIRSYWLQEIVHAEVTRQAFLPRYVVDL